MKLRYKSWRCFHCDFFTLDEKEATAHFGERDDAEEFKPLCKWWQRMDEGERAEALQDAIKTLTAEQDENSNLREALSASRADALKEAAAAICDYCKHRPETPPENRDGIWFHPEMSPRADGTEFDNSPTCKAQAILARMEKAS